MEEQKFLEMALPGAGLSKYPTWRTVHLDICYYSE